MSQTYLLLILVVGAAIGFFILRFIFGRLTKKPYLDLVTAQSASVEHHYLATSLNAVGLGLGIFLVFFMATWGELFITLGMTFVLLSIVAYVGFEWVAQYDDKEIARLQGIDHLDELDRQKNLVTNAKDLVAATKGGIRSDGGPASTNNMPNKLVLKNGYIEMQFDPNIHEAP
jgi:hypothetical protein